MTLEATIAENTAAIQQLIGTIKGNAAALADLLAGAKNSAASHDVKEASTPKKPQASTPATQPAAPAPTPSTAKVPPPAPSNKDEKPADPPAADAPDYATTAKAVNALVKAKGRQAAVDVLATFSAVTLKDVKPEQFAAVIAACEKAEA